MLIIDNGLGSLGDIQHIYINYSVDYIGQMKLNIKRVVEKTLVRGRNRKENL